ncbi:MAG: hypothetical protein F2849_05730 [Actinobacteria bacterium]|nr:hypothetical protein [Actinomycetota bacterium]
MSNADLSFAILRGVALAGANLSGVTWFYTICPNGTTTGQGSPPCAP